MRILLPVIVALVPLAIAPQFSFYFDITPKILVLCIGLSLALVAWTGDWPRAGSARIIGALLLAQIAWLGIATIFSPQPELSLAGGTWRRFGFIEQAAVLVCAMLVISDCIGRADRAAVYLRVIAAAGLPIALYGILQHFGLDPLVSSYSYHSGEGPFTIVRPPSTLGHASYLGTYLIYVVFAGVALAMVEGPRFWRTLGTIAALIAGLGVVFTGTRAAIGGVALGGLLLFLRLPSVRTKRVAMTVGLAAAGLVALVLSPAGALIRSRIHWSIDEPLGGARPLLWRDSAQMALRRPVAGYGPEMFGASFPRYQSVALSRAFPEFEHESPHNAILDVAIEQGIPGALLFCAIAALTLWSGFRQQSHTPVLAAGFAGALVAQQFNVFTVPTALMFYVTIALIASGDAAPVAVINRNRWRMAAAIPAVAMLYFAVRLGAADHQLAQIREALLRNDLAGTLAHYREEQRWDLPGTSADLYVSRELAALFQRTHDVRVKLQTWTPAFQAAQRATATSASRKAAFYNLAIFYATQNDVANVERCLRNTIYLAPNWYKPHSTLSRLLLTEGRLPEAQSEAALAASLDARNSSVNEKLSKNSGRF